MGLEVRQPAHAPLRWQVGAALGVAAFVVAALALVTPWQIVVLGGWDAVALVYGSWLLFEILRADPRSTQTMAQQAEDTRLFAHAMLLLASVISLVGVAFCLNEAAHAKGARKGVAVAVAAATVVISWALVHTLFTMRYARLFHEDGGGIDFHRDDGAPSYRDFAYVAFTIGMTFQVSDTELTSSRLRAAVLHHAALSYLFGTVILAMTINVVAGFFR
ncbi:MAG: DUF1345 domain-containing protein [Egibacteraceae bacterium]